MMQLALATCVYVAGRGLASLAQAEAWYYGRRSGPCAGRGFALWAQVEALHHLAAGGVRSASHIRKPNLTMVFGDQKQKVSYAVPLDLEVL